VKGNSGLGLGSTLMIPSRKVKKSAIMPPSFPI
jgi:hypothetical protein